jgi:hypothetical protein
MARGNQGQSIVVDDLDRLVWLETLAEGCEKTGWKFHADVLMVNHYHLLLEMAGGTTKKITWGGQVREKPLHLTPYDYFEQEQAKQKAKSTARQESVPAIVEYCLDAQAPAESIGGMARKLRVQYPGAIYHVMNRGDRR